MKVDTAKKNMTHTVYKLADGTRVPGVTTITGELGWAKETLCKWHNKMGIAGVDTGKYVDEKADIGTLAHAMITDDLVEKLTVTDEYSQYQIDQAENSYLSFCEWRRTHKIKVIAVEMQMVSELLRFGGTMDILAEVDDILELIDLKSEPFVMQKMPEYFMPSFVCTSSGVPLSEEKMTEFIDWMGEKVKEHNKKADEYNSKKVGK